MGNSVRDATLKYTGASNDRDPVLVTCGGPTPNNAVSGCSLEDSTMDGTVKYTGTANDRDPILVNVGGATPNTYGGSNCHASMAQRASLGFRRSQGTCCASFAAAGYIALLQNLLRCSGRSLRMALFRSGLRWGGVAHVSSTFRPRRTSPQVRWERRAPWSPAGLNLTGDDLTNKKHNGHNGTNGGVMTVLTGPK